MNFQLHVFLALGIISFYLRLVELFPVVLMLFLRRSPFLGIPLVIRDPLLPHVPAKPCSIAFGNSSYKRTLIPASSITSSNTASSLSETTSFCVTWERLNVAITSWIPSLGAHFAIVSAFSLFTVTPRSPRIAYTREIRLKSIFSNVPNVISMFPLFAK